MGDSAFWICFLGGALVGLVIGYVALVIQESLYEKDDEDDKLIDNITDIRELVKKMVYDTFWGSYKEWYNHLKDSYAVYNGLCNPVYLALQNDKNLIVLNYFPDKHITTTTGMLTGLKNDSNPDNYVEIGLSKTYPDFVYVYKDKYTKFLDDMFYEVFDKLRDDYDDKFDLDAIRKELYEKDQILYSDEDLINYHIASVIKDELNKIIKDHVVTDNESNPNIYMDYVKITRFDIGDYIINRSYKDEWMDSDHMVSIEDIKITGSDIEFIKDFFLFEKGMENRPQVKGDLVDNLFKNWHLKSEDETRKVKE